MYTITYRASFSGQERTRIVDDLADQYHLARILGDMVPSLAVQDAERAAERLARHKWAPELSADFTARKND